MPPITFIAHGSKKEEANIFLRDLVREVSESPSINIGFLELASPSISEALEAQIKQRAKQIRVIPLFFAPGKHTTEDIPRIIKEVSDKNPAVEIILEDFLGQRDEFKEFLRSLVRSL